MTAIPTPYLDGDSRPPARLHADSSAMLALAARIARCSPSGGSLSTPMLDAIAGAKRVVNAEWGWRVAWDTREGTVKALAARGMLTPVKAYPWLPSRDMTPLAIMVRCALTRTRAES